MTEDVSAHLHERVIGQLPVREWQIESQPIDNLWRIRTAREGERAKPVEIRFDVPIGAWPNPSRLDAIQHVKDLVTAKLLIWYAMEPAPIGWIRTGSSVPGFHRTNLNFIRWKHHMGIRSNSELTAAHHRDFVKRYRTKGLEGMLEIEARAKRLVAAHRAGDIVLPLGDRGYFFHAGIEELLGLTLNQTPPQAISVLHQYAQEREVRFQHLNRTRLTAQPRNTTKTTAATQLSTWQTLWNFNEFLTHDPLLYNAYASPGELADAYDGWAEDGRKTPDAPPYQTSWLINASIRFIFDNAIEDIFTLFEEGEHLCLGSNPIWERTKARFDALGFGSIADQYGRSRWQPVPEETPTFRELTFILVAAACVIAIAAFGARRDCELRALRPGCIQRDEFGEYWLHCWIAKNKRELTKIPTTRVVVRAVDVLERLTRLATKYGDPSWLLEYFDPHGPVDFKFNEALRQFATWVNVPPLDDGTFWIFASHQFRKFFAVSYQWRFFYPDFGALNHHMRQSIEVTASYTRMRGAATLRQYDATLARKRSTDWIEKDRGAALREEEETFIVEILRGMLVRGETLGGPKGRALTARLQKELSNQIHISNSGQPGPLNEELERLAKALYMRTHAEGHGLCGCGTSSKDIETAACLIEREKRTGERSITQSEPDMSFAEDVTCCHCVHNIRIKRLLPYWETAFDSAIAASRSSVVEVAEAGRRRADFIKNNVLSEF